MIGVWEVLAISTATGEVKPPASARTVEVEFLPVARGGESRLAGHAGVNRFFGTYSFGAGEGDTGGLTISGVGATRMAGPPEAMDFEQSFLSALAASRTITREGSEMVIDCGDVRIRLSPR